MCQDRTANFSAAPVLQAALLRKTVAVFTEATSHQVSLTDLMSSVLLAGPGGLSVFAHPSRLG